MNHPFGQGLHHDSAHLHVQGSARYVDDLPEPASMVHVAPGRATVASAWIRNMNLDPVAAAPGVVRVLTAADVPAINDCSPSVGGDPILAAERVDFHGQVLFAVVAETRTQARRAARLAQVDYEVVPPMVSVQQGMTAGADLLPPYTFERGAAAAAIAAAPRQLSGQIQVGGQEHFYLEGQVALAVPGEDGAMRVQSSTQYPSEVQRLVARMLGVADALVVCECRRMGGAFGGKESQAAQWACLAALAARATGRSAKCRLDRDDDMVLTGKRHDLSIDYRCGYDAHGRLLGVEVDLNARCGYSADLSLGVNDRAMFHADNAYFYPDVRIHSRRIRTNTVSNTAFRGFGGPQGMLFAERMMDAIAITEGVDPLTIRKRNLYRRGQDVTPYGMRVHDNVSLALIRALEKSSDYQARRKAVRRYNRSHRWLKKGIALTPVKFGIAFTLKHLNQAGALVHVFTDGSVQVNHSGTEMGQGLYIKVAQAVAAVFGLPPEQVHVTATRTDKVPNSGPTAASSGSDLNAMAAGNAARAIRDRLAELAARLYQERQQEVSFAQGQVRIGQSAVPFASLAHQAFLERVSLSATGYYATPKITWNRDSQTGRPFLYFAYGAACSEVSIDTLTGEVKVDRVDVLHDVGRSLNPAIDMGQIEGAFVQGMGWLMTEELVFDDAGRLGTHASSTYKIPTCGDVPEDFRVSLWASGRNREPTINRSKAVGEPPLMLAISVFSAITHAVASLGHRQVPDLDAPATPENILCAVHSVRDAR